MGLVTVQVWDATGNKRQEVEMPDDAPMNRVLAVLLEKMNFPQYAPDGQLLSYKFHHRASGKQLLDTQTLKDAGVKPGDVLRLQPEITAGAFRLCHFSGTVFSFLSETLRMSEVLRLNPDKPSDEDDRFHRFSLIGWWDQKKLAAAKVVVIGAGALGNEIIKNLALLGIGNLFVADKDHIENSNLSRSVLYRESDAGEFKATVAARAAKQIYPQMNVAYFNGDIIHDLGLGVFHWADLVIGGLDNREARLAINRACWKVNRPWIDGAIEQIQGVARVFVPDGPCYECTMSQRDWQLLQMRRSCNLLTREEMERGKTPTTPTISSIIAGVQCQEAVKLLHGMDTIGGKGWVFQGLSTDSYQTEYQRKPDCYSHDTLDEIVSLDESTTTMTARTLLHKAATIGGGPCEIDLNRDILEKLTCPNCKQEELLYESLGKVKSDRALCPACKTVRREVITFNKIRGDEPFLDRKLSEIGIPVFDIVTLRAGGKSIGLEFSSDAESVLGSLMETGLDFA